MRRSESVLGNVCANWQFFIIILIWKNKDFVSRVMREINFPFLCYQLVTKTQTAGGTGICVKGTPDFSSWFSFFHGSEHVMQVLFALEVLPSRDANLCVRSVCGDSTNLLFTEAAAPFLGRCGRIRNSYLNWNHWKIFIIFNLICTSELYPKLNAMQGANIHFHLAGIF